MTPRPHDAPQGTSYGVLLCVVLALRHVPKTWWRELSMDDCASSLRTVALAGLVETIFSGVVHIGWFLLAVSPELWSCGLRSWMAFQFEVCLMAVCVGSWAWLACHQHAVTTACAGSETCSALLLPLAILQIGRVFATRSTANAKGLLQRGARCDCESCQDVVFTQLQATDNGALILVLRMQGTRQHPRLVHEAISIKCVKRTNLFSSPPRLAPLT